MTILHGAAVIGRKHQACRAAIIRAIANDGKIDSLVIVRPLALTLARFEKILPKPCRQAISPRRTATMHQIL
jgi:hypothetical protein